MRLVLCGAVTALAGLGLLLAMVARLMEPGLLSSFAGYALVFAGLFLVLAGALRIARRG